MVLPAEGSVTPEDVVSELAVLVSAGVEDEDTDDAVVAAMELLLEATVV